MRNFPRFASGDFRVANIEALADNSVMRNRTEKSEVVLSAVELLTDIEKEKAEIRALIDSSTLSATAISVAIGKTQGFLSDFFRKGKRGLSSIDKRAIEKLVTENLKEPQAGANPPGNTHRPGNIESGPPRPVHLAPIRGETAAGVWFEPDAFVDEDQPLVPVIPGPYAGLEQFSYRVVGTSMDKAKILNGSFVVCVPYFDARGGIADGDIVVVERRRGQLIERTCKQLKIVRGGFELWPRSTDPKFQEPLRVIHDNGDTADGEEIEIVGLVIGVFAPIAT